MMTLLYLSASNGREMSCTPGLEKTTTAPFAVCLLVVFIDYDWFSCAALLTLIMCAVLNLNFSTAKYSKE